MPFEHDDHEVLGAVQRRRLEDHRGAHRLHLRERAVQAEDAELGEIDADRTGGQPIVAGERDGDRLAEVVLAACIGIDLDLGAHRADAEAGAQELGVAALAGPQVERAQRGTAGEIGEVG